MQLNEIFKGIAFCDYTTEKKLAGRSKFVEEYKGHTVALGATSKGYTVRVYENDGSDRIGIFALRGICAPDGEAAALARKWAKETIDRKVKED